MKKRFYEMVAIWVAFLCLSVPSVLSQCSEHAQAEALCGPSSLVVVCQRIGIKADLEELKALTGFSEKQGTSMLGLKQAAEAKGLRAVGMRIGLDELSRLEIPAIAHLWDSHFVVVESGGVDTLEVTDPPAEPKLVSKQEFGKSYSGFALLVARDDSAFPKPEAAGSDLRFDEYVYNFGFIDEGGQASHTFTYGNKGTEDLVISRVETDCGCTRALVRGDQRIPPGGKGELAVSFDSTGRQGRQAQTVFVHSNDPISPVVQLRIGGVVKPARVTVSVRELNFGRVKKRDGASRQVLIVDPGDGSLKVEEVKCDSPLVNVELTSSTDKDRLVYTARTSLRPDVPIGELAATITVRTNHPKEPLVKISMTADVRGDIEAFPNMFFFGLLKKGGNASKAITLSTSAETPVKVKSVESSLDFVKVSASPKTEGKEYTITASLNGEVPTGMIKGNVVIRTDSADQPEISLPLYALVEE